MPDIGGGKPGSPSGPSASGAEIVTEALSFLGVPYQWGGTSPSGFDCSGLVQYVYSHYGVTLPRTSEEQYAATARLDQSQLQAGDLVFSEMGSNGPGHVGIYDGQGGVVEAPHTGDHVKVLPLSEFSAIGYGRVTGMQAIQPGSSNPLSGIISGVESTIGGLFTFPSEIVNWAKQSADNASRAMGWFDAFFQPTTYVRIGAGAFGMLFLIAGLATLLVSGMEK